MSTEITDIESTALSAPDLAQKIVVIQTPEQYAKAGEFVVWMKDLRKAAEALHRPRIKAADQKHQDELDALNRLINPLKRAEAILDQPMRDYLALERRQREETTRIAEAAARQAEQEAVLAEAVHAEKAGADDVEVEAILATPIVVPSVVVPKGVPKVAGLSTTTEWLWKITDEKKIPRFYYDLAEARINAVVRTNKKLAEQIIPGIEVYSVERPRGARK